MISEQKFKEHKGTVNFSDEPLAWEQKSLAR